MFAKDYHLLNELYAQKISKENVGLGPLADNQGVTPSPSKIQKVSIPPKHACDKCGENEEGKEEDCEGYNPETYDSNGKMTRQLLFRVAKLSAMLHNLLKGKENVEAWVLSKITNAHDQIESVFGYEDYESALNPMQGTCGNLEENNEEDLYAAISKGGDDLVSQLKSALRRESKDTLEKVLFETIVLLENKKN